MKALRQYACFATIFSLLCLPSLPFIVQDNQIQDLIEQDSETNFAQEASEWTIINQLSPQKYTDCDGIYLLGGYANLGSTSSMKRPYTLPATHNTLKITALFTMIDDWGTGDTVFFNILDSTGSTVYRTQILNLFATAGFFNSASVDACGGSSEDLVDVYVQIETPHTGSFLEIVIETTNSNSGYLGLRELKILFSTETIASSTYCFIDGSSLLNRLFADHCYCLQGDYKYYDALNIPWCSSCHSSCATCATDSTNTECVTCKSNFYYTGSLCTQCSEPSCETCSATQPSQCISCPSGQAISVTHTCISTSNCAYPYSIVTTDGIEYCKFPCTSDQYLYSNHTCLSSCPTPFTKSTTSDGNFCTFPCSPTQSYYADRTPSCYSSCTWPYFPRQEGGLYNYCDRRCPVTSFLYWDNSCSADCPSPLSSGTPQNTQVCLYTCNPGEYLYGDRSCGTSCSIPFQPTVLKDMSLCLVPCRSSQFVLADGTCINSCSYPMKQVINANGSFCYNPCPSARLPIYNTDDNICVSNCSYPLILTSYSNYITCSSIPEDIESVNRINNGTEIAAIVTLTVAQVVMSNDAGSVSASMLAKMLQYIKYINISYPQHLEFTFKSHNSTSGVYRIGPKLSADVIEDFPFRPVPYRFLKFYVYSSFFLNFWDSLILLSIIFAVLFVLYVIECLFSKAKMKSGSRVRKIRVAIQNLFISQFYNVYGDVLMFFGIEARSLDLSSSGAQLLSFLLGLAFVFIGAIVIGIHIRVLIKFHIFRRKKSGSQGINAFSAKYEGFGVFFKQFKYSSSLDQSFLLLFVLRNLVFSLSLALLTDYPLIQAIIIFCLTLFILMYLLVNRSFVTLPNLLQQFSCELILLIVNICVLIMARLDIGDQDPNDAKETLGNIVIYSSVVFGFIPQFFLGVKILVVIAEYFKKKDNRSNQASSKVKIPRNVQLQNRLRNFQIPNPQNNSINDSSVELGIIANSSSLDVDTMNKSNGGLNLSGLDDSPIRGNSKKLQLMPQRNTAQADKLTLKERKLANLNQFRLKWGWKDGTSKKQK